MHSSLLLLPPIGCAAVLPFAGYRRHARRQHAIQKLRERIMFGTSTGYRTSQP